MMNYQKAYEDKVGSANLNVKKAIAGSKINCRLTYRVGTLGIDDSGSLKVLFRIITDSGELQCEDPQANNYVALTSSNKAVKILVTAKSGGLYGKIHTRPWSRGFIVNFSGNCLASGDEIYLDFKNWRVQTFCEKAFKFKILVDPFATAKYVELPRSPHLEIVPDRPHKLVIVAPTKVKLNKTFRFLIKVEDQWGNPCTNQNGIFAISQNKDLKHLPHKIRFTKGRAEIATRLGAEMTTYVKAKYNHLSSISNPITALAEPIYNHYWADLHGQSEETVGTNSVDDYFNFAKNYAFLDVASLQPNDFQVTKKFWDKINRTTKKFTKGGEFVAFPGYEWSGNTPVGGDRNVFYLDEGKPIFRSSHALVDQFDDLHTDAKTAKALFRKLASREAMVIAHVGGRFSNLAIHDKKLECAVEIHSDWGTFEWFLFEALKRQYQVGVVANSDDHTGRPGASYPSLAHFNSYGGLTCILAEELTRKSILKALSDRHCYATTGARIYLDVQCFTNGHRVGMMGDVIKIQTKPRLTIVSRGTAPLDRMEIFNGAKVMHTYFPEIREKWPRSIKIVWSGSKVKGRDRKFAWEGNLKLNNNSIETVQEINFFGQKNLVASEKNLVSWKGETSGGLQGLIINLKGKGGELQLNVNQKSVSLPLAKITPKPKTYPMGGLDARLEIYQTPSSDQPHNLKFEYEPKELMAAVNPVFVKTTQKDGHLAWSSPIYFIK